jgi:hypothetical protein
MWNFKTLKLIYHICVHSKCVHSKFQNFKTSKVIYHIWMGYNLHDVFKKLYFILNRIQLFKINIFWYDMKLSSFFKMKHKICKEFLHFYKFIFIKKWLRKKFIEAILIIFHNKLPKKSFKNHLYEKVFLGKKGMKD